MIPTAHLTSLRNERTVVNIISKIKMARLALLSTLAAALVFQAVPASAYPSPAFNLSGQWQNSAGEPIQIFQEKDRVVIVAVNHGFEQIIEGRYYARNKVKLVNLRRTRAPNLCETTMLLDITVVNNNKYQVSATALESTCGLTANSVYSDNNVIRTL